MTYINAVGDTTGEVEPVWRLPEAMYKLRPDAARELDGVNEVAWNTIDPALLELIRLRMAWLIGAQDGGGDHTHVAHTRRIGLPEHKVRDLASYSTSAEFSNVERDCLAFAEQFVMDVSQTSTEMRDTLAGHFGQDLVNDFVTAVYVVEFTQRLQLVSRALFASTTGEAPPGQDTTNTSPRTGSLQELLDEYQSAVMRGEALDPITTELVRLRCARTHRCRICQTLRMADAKEAGADDAMTAKIDFYEKSDLPEQYKVALRITDAFIIRPDTMDDIVVEQAHSHFSSAQLAELCLDITKWSTQKIHVAQGLDGVEDAAQRQGRAALPTDEAGVAIFHFDGDGQFGFGNANQRAGTQAG
ncbi:carboxymuconolactone decarboxylase family protein [Amycolatopsis pithecellobii]